MTEPQAPPGFWEALGAAAAAIATSGLALFRGRGVSDKLHRLQTTQHTTTMKVAVLESTLGGVKERLDRIEGKIDRVLERER